jgi:type II secretory pathway pseudopilin PulG
MVTCAVIAILAVIAVPFFAGQSRKAKAKSEVSTMFAELSAKEESYKMDTGNYLAPVSVCPAGAPTSAARSATACVGAGNPWTPLRVALPQNNLYCVYMIDVGVAGTNPTTGADWPAAAGFTILANPLTAWYFIVATCNMDGNAATNSIYLTSSLDSGIQIANEGH